MQPLGQCLELPNQTDRACIAFAHSEIDIAFGYVRIAEAECNGGRAAHASELILKASDAYKIALSYLGTLPLELEADRYELQTDLRKLIEAIQAVERRRERSLD